MKFEEIKHFEVYLKDEITSEEIALIESDVYGVIYQMAIKKAGLKNQKKQRKI